MTRLIEEIHNILTLVLLRFDGADLSLSVVVSFGVRLFQI